MSNKTHRKPKKLLKTQAAADYIGRHRSALDKWRSEKTVLPFYQDGPLVQYDIDDLDCLRLPRGFPC